MTTLVRTPGDEPARWVRAHEPLPARSRVRATPATAISSGFGSRPAGPSSGRSGRSSPAPTGSLDAEATRLLSLAADQLALGLRRDRLRGEATSAEIARRSDALKSALLDSVSHDLRTPLASIRATAGNLADPDLDWSTDEVRRAAETIDAEAQRLDRFVRAVLDLSRIESGALRPDLEVFRPAGAPASGR